MATVFNETFTAIEGIYKISGGQLTIEQCIEKYFAREDPENVEMDTRGQANNPYWHMARQGRITGTKIDPFTKQIGNCEKEFNYMRQVFKKSNQTYYGQGIQLNAMNYGSAYESVVFKMIQFLNPCKTFVCPGILPFRWPYSMFAASLDCVEVTDACTLQWGSYYEIKCLYSCRLDEDHIIKETYSQSDIVELLARVGKLSSKLFAKYTYYTGNDTVKLRSKALLEFFRLNKKVSKTVAYIFKYKEERHYDGKVSVSCELSDSIEFDSGKILLNPLHSYCKQMLMEVESIRQLNRTSSLNDGYLCSMISAKSPVQWENKNVYIDQVSYNEEKLLFKINGGLHGYLPKILIVTGVSYNDSFIQETIEPAKEAYIRNLKKLLESQ